MNTLFGEVQDNTKICRDCGIEKPLNEFAVNRKFYREDLPEKHYEIRRPTCNSCRSLKKGIDLKDKKFYNRPEKLQCPICEDNVEGSYARLDHCHKTGKIRGWLCDNCNTAIGKLKESPEVLRRALEWVEKDGTTETPLEKIFDSSEVAPENKKLKKRV